MKKILSVFLALIISCSCLSMTVSALTDKTDYKSVDVFADELAKLISSAENDSIDDSDIIREASVDDETSNRLIVNSSTDIDPLDSVAHISGYNDLHILQFDNEASFNSAMEYYDSLSTVEYVEEDRILTETVVDDGIIVESAADFPTEIPSNMFGYTTAKNQSADGNDVTIAVVDSGVQNDHEFLQGRVVPTGFNAITEDGTCYDDRGHGTQVAGIIVSNTLDNVKIKPYKVLNNQGEGSVSQVVLGIDAAIEDGVDIINLSMSMSGTSNSLYNACQRAYDANVAVVVAAGNAGWDMSKNEVSPGNFDNVISVVSCSNNRYVSDFSNYGGNADCAAPGEDIISSYLNNAYKISSGTSMAAPFICAAVAYILAENAVLSPDEIETTLLSNYKYCWGDKQVKCIYPSTVVTTTDMTAAPAFKYPNCSFTGSIMVEFTETTDTQIYYTFDNVNYHFYEGPFEITETTTVTAFAIEKGKHQSTTTETTFTKLDVDINDFIVDEDGNLISYNGTQTDVTVPGYINGYPVINVKKDAFSAAKSSLQYIVFASTLETIEDNAFTDFVCLKSVTAPSVTEVGDYCFSGCNGLESFYSKNLTTIGEGAFENTYYLSDFTSGVFTVVKDKTFKNSGIRTISLVDVTSIGDEAFFSCDNLSSVYSEITADIGVSAFEECSKLTTVTFTNVNKISDRCFYNCSSIANLTTQIVTELGVSAFEGCTSLLSIYMPNLKTVNDNSFKSCTGLSIITAPELSYIGSYAFYKTPITEFDFSNITYIGEYAFSQCTKLKNVTTTSFEMFVSNMFSGVSTITTVTLKEATELPLGEATISTLFPYLQTFTGEQILTLPDNAFSGCSKLKNINLPSVKSIGDYAFADTLVTKLSFETLETVGPYSFADMTKLTEVNLPALTNMYTTLFSGSTAITSLELDGVTNISDFGSSFSFGSNFPSLTTFSANSLKNIPAGFFTGTTNLRYIYLNSVETVDENAFKAFKGYSLQIHLPKATSIGENAFYNCNVMLLNLSSLEDFNSNIFGTSSSSTLNILSIPSVKELPASAFNYTTGIQQLDISGVEYLPKGIFNSCQWLERLDASSVKTMADDVFYYSTRLSEVDLSSLTQFPGAATFKNFTNLSKIIANSVTKIPASTFEGCTLLVTATMPNVTEIGNNAFYGSGIKTYSFTNVKSIGDYAFSKSKVASVNATYLNSLGVGAFDSCTSLTSVNVPALTEIPDYAFNNTTSLNNATFGKLTSVGSNSFANSKISSFKFTLGSVFELGEMAFYNCSSLSFDPTVIKRLGSQSVYNTTIINSASNLPNLEYIDVNGFDGTSLKSDLILENVIDVYDLPEGSPYVLIGSDCVNFEIDSTETTTVYSPKLTAASEWCVNNGYENYIEYNSENIVLSEKNQLITTKSSSLGLSIIGFNTTYKLYGTNNKDMSDSKLLTTSTYSSFTPLTLRSQNQIEKMYDYYYVVAEDNENGNITEVVGSLSENTLTYIKPIDDLTVVDFDFYSYSDHIIYSSANSYEEALDALSINDEHVTVTPSYQIGESSVYGTGTTFNVYYDDELIHEYKFALIGDLNGDGVIDALDCSELHKYTVGFKDAYACDLYLYYAIDGNLDGYVDVNDYQDAVNKTLA